ncbi:CoA transferase subunit A [Acinetobacter brisouii]
MNKIYPDSQSAIFDIIQDNMVLAVGGFGLCGIPEMLIETVRDSNAQNLTCISNNAGIDGIGLSLLLESRQVKKMISSYIGGNKEFERQYLSGELEVELTPQGTMAEKLRAAGAGIPAFYTRTGVGTVVQDGKEIRNFDGKDYLLEMALHEMALHADIALVKAYKADKAGNLVFRKTARNINPDCAVAGKITIAEVEQLVEIGDLDPDEIHLPGIYIDRIVVNTNPTKHIEIRTVKTKTV